MTRRRRTMGGEIRAFGAEMIVRLLFVAFMLLVVLPVVVAYLQGALPAAMSH